MYVEELLYNNEIIEHYDRLRVLCDKHKEMLKSVMIDTNHSYGNECEILIMLENGLNQEYKEMIFDTSHVKYILPSDLQFKI